MDLKQIQELIRFVSKAGVSEVQLEQDNFKIIIKTRNEEAPPQVQHIIQAAPAPQAPPQAAAQSVPAAPIPATPVPDDISIQYIKSPMIGTFWSKPSPDKDVFVKVGDRIKKGQVVCVIEAMKIFNEIESEVSGTIIEIMVDDKTPVDYEKPLFKVKVD